ncbi:hypothetical protein ACR2SE_28490 (plasmid) [Citrobacter freundii]|uniref:hypothetical protein n=1 Tax=Citrobacter freundii TaxID=546 RepID=UPI002938CC76|nr:hypothetical protein [Citrobacter freundii]ELR9580198.1 hypothetical protein [Citrobacter freundii]
MTKQTIKITGLAEYSPLTDALANEYNGLQSNAAKRRLMLDCLRYGYALEKMGLGALVALMERQDLMALPESERAERFISMAMSLMGMVAADHQPKKQNRQAAPVESEALVPVKVSEPTPLPNDATSVKPVESSTPGTKPYQVESERVSRPIARLSRPSDDSNT